jgi:CRISPR system Cascade subunit CasE
MTDLILSRIRLRRDASVRALAPLLLPEGQARVAAAHRLVWALFADGDERRRDFLWREERPGHFLALSSRPPAPIDLFDVDSTPFAPSLARGDRLAFALRANAVIARSAGPGQRGRRHDVVMDTLYALPQETRAAARLDAVAAAGRAWLARQGALHGFTPDPGTGVDGYDRMRIDRDGGAPAIFGVIDFNGALQVDDPGLFLKAVAAGLGRARAFGCGLMLIRRI